MCERSNSADTKVGAEAGGGGVPDVGVEIPLQLVAKTVGRQAVPLQSMEANQGAETHLKPVEGPVLEQVDVPEEGCDPMGSPCCSRLLAGLVQREAYA